MDTMRLVDRSWPVLRRMMGGHTVVYRATRGVVGHRFPGAPPMLLLDHVDESLTARQRNEERMRAFVADASHELRTPLSSIRGYSELSLKALSRGPGDATIETTEASLERIQAQSLRMLRTDCFRNPQPGCLPFPSHDTIRVEARHILATSQEVYPSLQS